MVTGICFYISVLSQKPGTVKARRANVRTQAYARSIMLKHPYVMELYGEVFWIQRNINTDKESSRPQVVRKLKPIQDFLAALSHTTRDGEIETEQTYPDAPSDWVVFRYKENGTEKEGRFYFDSSCLNSEYGPEVAHEFKSHQLRKPTF